MTLLHPPRPVPSGSVPRRSHRRITADELCLIALTSALAAACSDPAKGTPTGSAPTSDALDERCAWAVRADKETLNIAYPDTGAVYWAVNYDLAPGESLELEGRFPSARYASFFTYGPAGDAIEGLTDHEIVADPDSANPFAGGFSAGTSEQRYTAVIATEDDDRPNALSARSEAEPASSPPPVDPDAAGEQWAIRLGSGGPDAVSGTVLYRVYLWEDPDDPTGGAGLPAVTAVSADGDRREVPTCETPGGSPAAVRRVEEHGPETDIPAPAQPIFRRPESTGNLFPNPDNVYIATIVAHEPGRVVVVRGKAPTFPDPPKGRPVGSGEQLRYWSLCTNEYRKPYPVSFCAVDRDVLLDDAGAYTFVISTPEDRPENATAESGVTWLEWGSTAVDNLLLMRHMLANPDFAESALYMDPGAFAASSMGEYAPEGIYCDKEVFEERGPEGCYQ